MGTIPKESKLEITAAYAAESWKVCLLSSSFSYVSGTHITYANVSASEITGTGYTAGGAALTLSSSQDSTNAKLDATDVSWGPGATFSNVGFAVLYNTSTGRIKDIKTINPAQSVTSGTFTVIWNASGILKVS